MTPEGKIKNDVKYFLSSLPDCWYFMPVSMGYGRRGIPDFIGCWRGKFFAIETKAPNGKSHPWQEREQKAIREAGGVAFRARTMEEIYAVFREI